MLWISPKKALLTGIGLALTAKDEAEDLAKEFEKKLNLNEEEGKKFLKDIQKRYEDTQNKLEARVEKSVKEFLKKSRHCHYGRAEGIEKGNPRS